MPTEHHREQAQSNEAAAQSVRTSYPDWAITMCFYSALHWVEQYASMQGCDIEKEYKEKGKSRHDRRRQYVIKIASNLSNKNLRLAYLALEEESKNARYLKNLNKSAIAYYTQDKNKVTNAFQKLQIVRQLLSR